MKLEHGMPPRSLSRVFFLVLTKVKFPGAALEINLFDRFFRCYCAAGENFEYFETQPEIFF